MDPKTGEVLALASSPNFDPHAKKLEENWQSMIESPDAPFLCVAPRDCMPRVLLLKYWLLRGR